MKKLGIAAGVVVGLIVVLLGVASMQPDSYTVERSRTYDAPTSAVWATVSDMNQSAAWSPWQKYDPNMKIQVEGQPATVGHKYSWQGNSDAGSGSMTVSAVDPGKRLDIALEFKEPFASTATTAYILSEEGGKAKMTWTMSGNNDLMGKVFGLFMSMEEMIGKDFEDGLGNLEKALPKAAG